MKILVVDDHATVRLMTTRLLASLGHTPLEARDEAEAQAILSDEVEVILIDLHLGGVDGGALAGRLEARRSGVHILFMSGVGEDVFAARELGGPRRGFIEKPFSLRRLSDALAALVTPP